MGCLGSKVNYKICVNQTSKSFFIISSCLLKSLTTLGKLIKYSSFIIHLLSLDVLQAQHGWLESCLGHMAPGPEFSHVWIRLWIKWFCVCWISLHRRPGCVTSIWISRTSFPEVLQPKQPVSRWSQRHQSLLIGRSRSAAAAVKSGTTGTGPTAASGRNIWRQTRDIFVYFLLSCA